jgi:hypothetical protein
MNDFAHDPTQPTSQPSAAHCLLFKVAEKVFAIPYRVSSIILAVWFMKETITSTK